MRFQTLQVHSQIRPGLVSVRVGGALDQQGSRGFQDEMELILQHPTDLELDLQDVGFMDSEGVRIVLKYRKRVRASGHTFAVIAASGSVRKVLAILKLDTLLLGCN